MEAAKGAGRGGALLTTRIEHAAVRDAAEALEQAGEAVRWNPLRGGLVDVAALSTMLTPDVAMVSVQWANNETGLVQPIKEIGLLCRERGVLLHVDAVQWAGKELIVGARAWCDMLSISAHKFHGPKGVGVLWVRKGVRIAPRLPGTQELGRRAGTENVPGIAGAGAAARAAMEWLGRKDERARLSMLRDVFEVAVRRIVPDAVVNIGGPAAGSAERLWNTSNIGFPGLEAEALLMLMSEKGLCVSAGAACSSGSLEPSPVLLAMGIEPRVAHGSIRFSLSRETTEQEVRDAAELTGSCVRALRAEG